LLGPERMRRVVGEQSPLMAMPALSLPGLNVPVGIAKGLPVGVQLVADSMARLRKRFADHGRRAGADEHEREGADEFRKELGCDPIRHRSLRR
jgi:hypothetical protein